MRPGPVPWRWATFDAEPAALLTIAEPTTKTHVKRILVKIGARDRVQASSSRAD
ncbi:hypothetical protein AB0M46_10820 [Dactylosporangium sp. NPDC051485]|uniref:hypothetical protein n=1 Tax=Dactylosporangium sp. NPDC051485 TaxID=3154846 RepID=UPI003433C3E4